MLAPPVKYKTKFWGLNTMTSLPVLIFSILSQEMIRISSAFSSLIQAALLTTTSLYQSTSLLQDLSSKPAIKTL